MQMHAHAFVNFQHFICIIVILVTEFDSTFIEIFLPLNYFLMADFVQVIIS